MRFAKAGEEGDEAVWVAEATGVPPPPQLDGLDQPPLPHTSVMVVMAAVSTGTGTGSGSIEVSESVNSFFGPDNASSVSTDCATVCGTACMACRTEAGQGGVGSGDGMGCRMDWKPPPPPLKGPQPMPSHCLPDAKCRPQ